MAGPSHRFAANLNGRRPASTSPEPQALDGSYTLHCASTSPRTLQFVRNSFIHEERPISGVIPIEEWTDIHPFRGRSCDPPREWQDVPQAMDNLLEAIYAVGRGGWNESELVALLERLLPGRMNPWDFLRSLQESSILTPCLRSQFRGRVWVLGQIRLVPLRPASDDVVVVDGCLGALLADDFRSAVLSLGGAAFRVAGSEWTVPLLGAVGVEVNRLSDRLGWRQKQAVMPGNKRAAFDDARLRHRDPYDPAYSWSWEAGRFAADTARASIRLTRWVHRGRRDHDVYEVSNQVQERRFLSRTSAILYAHMLADRPLYKFVDGALSRQAKDGFIPDRLAGWLRYANIANPSVSIDGGYSYPSQPEQAAKIASLLDGAIDAGVVLRPAIEVVSSVRRSGWAERMIWKDARLSSGRAPFGPADRSSP